MTYPKALEELPITERDKELLATTVHGAVYVVPRTYLNERYKNPLHPADSYDMDCMARRILALFKSSLGHLQAAHATAQVMYAQSGIRSIPVTNLSQLIDPHTNLMRAEVVVPLFQFSFQLDLITTSGTSISISLDERGGVKVETQDS